MSEPIIDAAKAIKKELPECFALRYWDGSVQISYGWIQVHIYSIGMIVKDTPEGVKAQHGLEETKSAVEAMKATDEYWSKRYKDKVLPSSKHREWWLDQRAKHPDPDEWEITL